MDRRAAYLVDILDGLSQQPKFIAGKYFRDEGGSRLFEKITHAPDYYQTAAEYTLTREVVPQIAAMLGRNTTVVEFGSGASRKSRQVLGALALQRDVDMRDDMRAQAVSFAT